MDGPCGELDNPNGLEAIREAISGDTFSALTTDERFEIVIAAVHAPRQKRKQRPPPAGPFQTTMES